jgi:hypothetical protein
MNEHTRPIITPKVLIAEVIHRLTVLGALAYVGYAAYQWFLVPGTWTARALLWMANTLESWVGLQPSTMEVPFLSIIYGALISLVSILCWLGMALLVISAARPRGEA